MKNSIWAYSWDLFEDKSYERIVDTGIDGITLATVYHHAQYLRPMFEKKVLYKDAAIYFKPDDDLFRDLALQPIVRKCTKSPRNSFGPHPKRYMVSASFLPSCLAGQTISSPSTAAKHMCIPSRRGETEWEK